MLLSYELICANSFFLNFVLISSPIKSARTNRDPTTTPAINPILLLLLIYSLSFVSDSGNYNSSLSYHNELVRLRTGYVYVASSILVLYSTAVSYESVYIAPCMTAEPLKTLMSTILLRETFSEKAISFKIS